MTTQINAGQGSAAEAPAVVATHPLAERIEKLLDETRWTRERKAAEQRDAEAALRVSLEAQLSGAWEASGMRALLGDGVISDEGETLSIWGHALAGDVELSVRLYLYVQLNSPYSSVGLEIDVPPFTHGMPSHWRLCSDVEDITDYVVEKVLHGVKKVRAARLGAAALLEQAQACAQAWQAWDAACRAYAGDMTLRLWEPVELWRLQAAPMVVGGGAAADVELDELVVLEAPADFSGPLWLRRPTKATVVAASGQVSERWIFGVAGMEPVAAAEPTIEEELPYYRTYRVGLSYVNVPVTAPEKAPEVVELADVTAHKTALSTVLGVEEPTGRWYRVCEELGWPFPVHEGENEEWVHESYWPLKLAKMSVEELVQAWGASLARWALRGE